MQRKRIVRNVGLTFKAKHMGMRKDSLYRYLTGRWKKSSNFDERYAAACKAYDNYVAEVEREEAQRRKAN